MRFKLSDSIALLITLLFATGIVVFFFSHIVTNPGHIIIESDGDAIKNYFAYLYHIMYGKGVWFNGMNYPYGDNIIYPDSQPLLSVPLSYLRQSFHLTVENALMVMHLVLALSYVLAIVYTYKILRRFKVGFLPAMLFAGVIIVFSPQVLRFLGHYGLCYSCIIPMLFYWSVKYHDTQQWKNIVYISIVTCAAMFMHLYFLAIIEMWACLYILGYIILTRTPIKQKLKHIVPVLIGVGVPSLFYISLIPLM